MPAAAAYPPGAKLAALRKRLTEQQILDFEATSATLMERDLLRNIHNDPELARATGLARPIASGMVSVSFLNQLLRGEFGESWTHGGRLAVSFIRSLHADDEAIVQGLVQSAQSDGSQLRLELEVWCENQDGERVTTGSASLSVPLSPA